MMQIQRRGILALGLVIGLAGGRAAYAGSMVDLSCTNKACNYTGHVNMGGGFMFDQITGYCAHDSEFVYLRWKREVKAPNPRKVWDHQTGHLIELYSCPKCTDPFLPIKKLDDLKFCPKCNRATLEARVVGAYD